MNGTIGTLIDLKKDDMKMSSARIIFATIETECGSRMAIQWVNLREEPTFGHFARELGLDFEDAWNNAVKDMKVFFYFGVHGFSLVE